jgi:hypothetical protein
MCDQITNDLVCNQLIINQAIEQIALIPDRERAFEFMRRPADARKNVKVVYALDPSSRKQGYVMRYNAASGNFSQDAILAYQGKYRMSVDKDSQIR